MKEETYKKALRAIESVIEGETDLISVMSTIACELYHAFDYFNWVGFYRRVQEDTLKVGPYQGTHGCVTIQIDRGVCGKCVREAHIQIENDVSQKSYHIACSSDTRAEIVLPVLDCHGQVCAVLDIDATQTDVFDLIDVDYLRKICDHVSRRYL